MAVIGKNVIENLTTAMYEDLRIIYREYIQNSADSIDCAIREGVIIPTEARIEIEIDSNARYISCTDNGTGIKQADFERIMTSIADSEKDRTEDKGFRGIGRLGGISSCKMLRFSCSTQGENIKSICSWNAEYIRSVLVDSTKKPSAAELVDVATEFDYENCAIDEHFFMVELIDVEETSNDLLNVDDVKGYLRIVAPVPYSTGFIFRSSIHDFATRNNLHIDEYQVFVNGERLFKPYTTFLYEPMGSSKRTYDEILDVAFESFYSSDGKLLAWMWYGISKFEKRIPSINVTRGIRLRKANIQIGNENTFSAHGFYKEPRGSMYFIGEVFAVDVDLIPNARRDYFNLNTTCREFERCLYPIFFSRFNQIYQKANEYKNATKKQAALIDAENEYEQQASTGSFINSEEKDAAKKKIEDMKKAASDATKKIGTLDKKASDSDDDVMKRVYGAIRKNYQPIESDNAKNENSAETNEPRKKEKKYLPQHLPLRKNEQKLVSRIYAIIKLILPNDTAKLVINKIQEELSNTGRNE